MQVVASLRGLDLKRERVRRKKRLGLLGVKDLGRGCRMQVGLRWY